MFPSKQEHILHEQTADMGEGGGHSLALPRHAARPVFRAASLLADGFSGKNKREKKKIKSGVSFSPRLVTVISQSTFFIYLFI